MNRKHINKQMASLTASATMPLTAKSLRKKFMFLLGIVFLFSMKSNAQETWIKIYSDNVLIETVDDWHNGWNGIIRASHDIKFETCNSQNEFMYRIQSENDSKVEQPYCSYVFEFAVGGYYNVEFNPNVVQDMWAFLFSNHGHTFSEDPTVPTCNTIGRPVQCSECKRWFWDTRGELNDECAATAYKPVLGHDFSDQEWTIDEVKGGKFRTCTRQGCEHKQYSYDVVPGEPALEITLSDGSTLTYPQSMRPVYAQDGTMWKVTVGETTACELAVAQATGISTQWPHNVADHQCADKSWTNSCTVEGCAEGLTKRWIDINGNKVETTETTGALVVNDLTLNDAAGYVCEADFTAVSANYNRKMTSEWGTLCLPFEIQYDVQAAYKFYRLKDVKTDVIVLSEVTENIPAGTPLLVRRPAESEGISLQATDAAVTHTPAAGSTANGLSLVGQFVVSDALAADSYIISNNTFWRVGDLIADNQNAAVKVGAFRAYLQADAQQSAKMMDLSVEGDDVTEIVETLNGLTGSEAAYFDLNGKRQAGLRRGVNIVKRNGKTMKVIIN